MRLPHRALNSALTTPDREVVLIEAVPCSAGDMFVLAFESAEDRWRQGVWLAVDGALDVNSQNSDQAVLWQDTAPVEVRFQVRETHDGLLRFYNVWDSGRGLGPWESQMHTSGMLREQVGDGVARYSCSDIKPDPTFKALVFTLTRG
jgi:hypothetical protein